MMSDQDITTDRIQVEFGVDFHPSIIQQAREKLENLRPGTVET